MVTTFSVNIFWREVAATIVIGRNLQEKGCHQSKYVRLKFSTVVDVCLQYIAPCSLGTDSNSLQSVKRYKRDIPSCRSSDLCVSHSLREHQPVWRPFLKRVCSRKFWLTSQTLNPEMLKVISVFVGKLSEHRSVISVEQYRRSPWLSPGLRLVFKCYSSNRRSSFCLKRSALNL